MDCPESRRVILIPSIETTLYTSENAHTEKPTRQGPQVIEFLHNPQMYGPQIGISEKFEDIQITINSSAHECVTI